MWGLGDAFITFIHIFLQKYLKSIFSKKSFFTILTAVLLLSVFAALTLASLSISIAVTEPDNISICENATHTVNITNTESTPISNIMLNIMMPDGFWYTTNTTNIASNSGEGDASDTYLKIGNMPSQYLITNVTNVTYYLADNTFGFGNLTNGASKIVTFDFDINHGACNATSATPSIEPIKHLAVLIEVKDVGKTYAYDMNLTELLPSGLQYVAGSSTVTGATPSSTNFTGNPLIWGFNQSEGWTPGTDVTITFNMAVTGPCDFTGGNSVAGVNYTVPCRNFGIEAGRGVKANDANPYLSITKTPSLTIAESGNTVNWTITIKSDRAYEAKNITLKDVLPSNTEYVRSDPVRNGGTETSGDPLVRNLTNVTVRNVTTIHLYANVTECTADITENNATVFRDCCIPKKKSSAITELRTSPGIDLSKDHDYIDTCGGNYTIRIKNTGSSASVVSIIDVLPEGFVYRDDSSNITSSNGSGTFTNEEPYIFGPKGPDIAYDSNGVDVTSKVNKSDGECVEGSVGLVGYYWVNGMWNTGLPAGSDVINANFSCTWRTSSLTTPPSPDVVGEAHTLCFEYWNETGWEEIGNKSDAPDQGTVDWVDVTSFLSDDYQNLKLRCLYIGFKDVEFDYLSLEIEIEDIHSSNIQKTPDYHRNATIGEELNFTLFIDLPKAHVYNLTVNDTLSDGWICNKSSFNIRGNDSVAITDYSSSYINWIIGTVNNSDDGDVWINFTAIVNDTVMNRNGVNLSNNATMYWKDHAGLAHTDSDISANATIIEPDLGINKSANPATGYVGDTITYTILVFHTANSTSDAYDVWINDTMDERVDFIAGSNVLNPPADLTVESGRNISWMYNIIPVKYNRTNPIVLRYNATLNISVTPRDILVNNVSLMWTSTEGVNPHERCYKRDNSSQVRVKNASIDLTKTVWNGTAWVDSCNKDIGDNVVFNLAIRNTGTDPLINITVNDTLPSGLSNASWINNSRTWAFDRLSTGGTIHIEFNATVNSSMVLVNQADVTARAENTSMPVFDEDNATVLAGLTEADLSIIQSDSPDPVIAGKYLRYEINVTNNGPDYARNVNVTDVLPGGVVFSSASPSPNGSTGRVHWWNFTGIEANSSILILIYVGTGAAGSLENTVNVTSATHDPNETNNADTEYTTVRGGGGGGSDSHDIYDDSTPDEQERIDGTDPNNPDTGDGTRLHPPPGTNDRRIPDPVSPITPGLVIIPFIAFIFFTIPLILSRVDVVDNGEIRPAEMSMLMSTVYVPEGVKIGKVLPGGIVRVKADRALYTYLCETYDIPPSSAKAITIALGQGGLARVILQDEKAYDLAIKMGLNAVKRS